MANVSVILDRRVARGPSFTLNESSFCTTEASNLVEGSDHNNNDNDSHRFTSFGVKDEQVQAVLFKYRRNVPKKDIDEIRRLLTLDRASQSVDEQLFYKFDYERLMEDNWLITRFILRGMKASLATTTTTQRTLISQKLGMITSLADQENESNAEDQYDQLDKTIVEQSIYARTTELIRSCAKFRYQYRISKQTNLDEFPLDWTSIKGLFNYKPDIRGNSTIYLRVALHRPKLIESNEMRFLFKRFMLYTLEQADQDLHNQAGKAICCVFDLTNVALENIDLELTTWMIRSFKSCGPKLVCYVIVYNPPWFFTTTFKLICSTLLSGNKKQCVKFVYGEKILNFISFNNLPPYLKSSFGG